jgi:hypothetical protein
MSKRRAVSTAPEGPAKRTKIEGALDQPCRVLEEAYIKVLAKKHGLDTRYWEFFKSHSDRNISEILKKCFSSVVLDILQDGTG